MEQDPRELLQEDARRSSECNTSPRSREGREPSEVGDHAMGGEVRENHGEIWRRREDPRLVANVGVDAGVSQGSEGADLDEVR